MPDVTETPAALFAGSDASPFGRRQRRARGARVPVSIVTGFLGSGKTTLVRELLKTPEGADTAVIVNEFGEVGIDDALLRGSSDTTVLLGNGCVCCLMRSDLQETLRALLADRARGATANFRRVVIETSGLADPGPVLQTFASDRALGAEFHLQSLVAVVDAVGGPGNLAGMEEARHQVALADRIVVTKTDLVPLAAFDALTEDLRRLSAAPIATARDGVIEPGFLLDDAAEALPVVAHHDHHHHADGIDTFTVLFDKPLAWEAIEQAMAVLTALRGPDLLRVKGLVAVDGCRGPVVIHAVQQVAHQPIELETWPTDDHRSRLVFITRNLGQDVVERLFAAVSAVVK